jgi:hypothetical protein
VAVAVERRVATLEASLTPTGIVRRWLAEAQAFDDLAAYATSLLDAPSSAYPLDRCAAEAEGAVRAAAPRGQRPEVTAAAVQKAVQETWFRIELVFGIAEVTDAMLDRDELIGLGLARPRRDRAAWQRRVVARPAVLSAMEIARTTVEARYLDGDAALFPADGRRWEAQRKAAEELIVSAARRAERDGADPVPAPEGASPKEVDTLVAHLVEPARIRTLERLGDGLASHARAIRWLRPALAPGQAS